MTQKAHTKESIWALVDKQKSDACWPWKGYVNTEKRGRVNWCGRMTIAPRLIAYFEGLLPDLTWSPNTNVLHTCDNANCCNPAHLYIGSQRENNKDAYNRNRRQANQGRRGKNKLTAEQIAEMRRLHDKTQIGSTTLARQFGVSQETARQIIKRVRNYSK